MRVIVQRVNYAKCHIDGQVYSEINHGFMILVGIKETDTNVDKKKLLVEKFYLFRNLLYSLIVRKEIVQVL